MRAAADTARPTATRVRALPTGEVRIETDGAVIATVRIPALAYGLQGRVVRAPYGETRPTDAGVTGTATWSHDGIAVALTDEWTAVDGAVLLRRRITADGRPGATAALQLALEVDLAETSPRFFAPGMAYSPGQWAAGGTFSYADSRLAYPLVAAVGSERTVALRRERLAAVDSAPVRERGDSRFVHRTQLGSVGFRAGEAPALVTAWPTYEGDRSAALDSAGTPASAHVPLDAPLDVVLEYRLEVLPGGDFTAAIERLFRAAVDHADPRPSGHAVSLAESIDLRLDSAAKTYAVSPSGFAGFILNFDPERGYESQAKAFGASFADHEMGGSHWILEYGFTGRQLNLAALLGRRDPVEWLDKGAGVVDSFVTRMATQSGWVATLWDFQEDRPLYAVGDERGTVMHYLGVADVRGTYSRMMTEAGHDLLLNIALHSEHGRDVTAWREAAARLGDFFVRHQNEDGSWFRAYAPDGTPVVDTPWFGDRSGSAKTATGAVVPYLLELAAAVPERAEAYRAAAERAGDFVQAEFVDRDEYRGGTLDNPNLVDKEAAFITMRALLALYEAGSADRLEGARRAGLTALTWHSLWNVPNVPGTALAEADVRSTGWGGINSVWGVGVTDIYSLFFAADLVRLGRLVDDPLFARIAELIAHSSLELLAVPGALHGFQDAGMQPEGISFLSQGTDDGLITKGDTWGGLGWPYTAGTDGLGTYLAALPTP